MEERNGVCEGGEIACDIAVIGGGPGGYEAALEAARLGASVVLAERDAVGGTCLNRGCIPTKALLSSARAFRAMKQAEKFGCSAENVRFDLAKAVRRKDEAVSRLTDGVRFLLKSAGVRTVSGTAELSGGTEVAVRTGEAELRVRAKNILVATGSAPAVLNVPGADLPGVLSSDRALALSKLPESLTVIGGGVIGMEFACLFAAFGVPVSVVEFFGECLSGFDSDVCASVARSAKQQGIALYRGAKVTGISEKDGGCEVSFEDKKGGRSVLSEKVLMAVGRTPDAGGLDLEKAGVERNAAGRGIRVDGAMRTSAPHVYAAGDVTGRVMLAHAASRQGVIAVRNMLGRPCEMDESAVPSAVFTDPEVARVGVSEKSAKAQGRRVSVSKCQLAANGRAVASGDARGFVKLIAAPETGVLLGGSAVGLHASEIIAEIALAVSNRLTAEQVAETVHAHPTVSEAVFEAAKSARRAHTSDGRTAGA